MKLSVIIPAHNEEGSLGETVNALVATLEPEAIDYEVVVINDSSTDDTAGVARALAEQCLHVQVVDNAPPHGYGFAVRRGIAASTGDAVAIMMADAADDPVDLVRFYRAMVSGDYECVFGTRWSHGGQVIDYPMLKRLINRAANWFIRVLLRIPYDDVTNAFKLYRRDVLLGCEPLLSHHFNLTVELPLKAIIRGYSYTVLPNSWRNRKVGVSKLRLHEMGSRYLFIVLYCLLEKWLSRRDYHRNSLYR